MEACKEFFNHPASCASIVPSRPSRGGPARRKGTEGEEEGDWKLLSGLKVLRSVV